MRNLLAIGWSRIPATLRKGIVLFIGSLFIIAAGLTGWLPGPGGIPLFLIGIAILATEFEWAKQLRDYTLDLVHRSGHWLRAHPLVMWSSIALTVFMISLSAYLLYLAFTS